MILTKESILKQQDLVYEDVEVPEWGGTVRVRTMTGAERDAFEGEVYEIKGDDIKVNKKNFRARLLARTLCDEANNLLFDAGDIAELGKRNAIVLDRLFTVAQRINALNKSEQDQMVKN